MLASLTADIAYRNLKVDHLVGEGGHFIVEAESILPRVLCVEDEITLSFFLSFHYFLVIRSVYRVIDVE